MVSPNVTSNIEVTQGSIQGLLLFILFISDLPSACRGADVQIEADDTVIYSMYLEKKKMKKLFLNFHR